MMTCSIFQAYSKKLEGEASIQNLLDKETSTLNVQVEELQEKLDKAKRELKQKRENEETTAMEIESLKRVRDKFLKSLY